MPTVVRIDDQPIAAAFFGQVSNLTDFITPDDLEVTELYRELTKGLSGSKKKILACWRWVANEVKYVNLVRGKITIDGKTSVQNDLWQMPSMVVQTRVGNCANKSFLLASLLRNELPADQVYCVLGNLHNGISGGHAWIQVILNGEPYTMESTTPTAPPLVLASAAKRYEAVHFFNEQDVFAVEGRTQLMPFSESYSTWLETYLNWAYIESRKKELPG